MIPFVKSPECDQGKHANCHGDAWDAYRDCLSVCECPCHYGLKEAS